MKYLIRICQGVNCQNYLSEDLLKHARKLTADNQNIEVEQRSCMNLCETAPNLQVINESTNESSIYNKMDYEKLEELIGRLS